MSSENDVLIGAMRLVKQFKHTLGIGVMLAVAANILPTWCVERVKPAEVLRNE